MPSGRLSSLISPPRMARRDERQSVHQRDPSTPTDAARSFRRREQRLSRRKLIRIEGRPPLDDTLPPIPDLGGGMGDNSSESPSPMPDQSASAEPFTGQPLATQGPTVSPDQQSTPSPSTTATESPTEKYRARRTSFPLVRPLSPSPPPSASPVSLAPTLPELGSVQNFTTPGDDVTVLKNLLLTGGIMIVFLSAVLAFLYVQKGGGPTKAAANTVVPDVDDTNEYSDLDGMHLEEIYGPSICEPLPVDAPSRIATSGITETKATKVGCVAGNEYDPDHVSATFFHCLHKIHRLCDTMDRAPSLESTSEVSSVSMSEDEAVLHLEVFEDAGDMSISTSDDSSDNLNT